MTDDWKRDNPIFVMLGRGFTKTNIVLKQIENLKRSGRPIIITQPKNHGLKTVKEQMALYESIFKGENNMYTCNTCEYRHDEEKVTQCSKCMASYTKEHQYTEWKPNDKIKTMFERRTI